MWLGKGYAAVVLALVIFKPGHSYAQQHYQLNWETKEQESVSRIEAPKNGRILSQVLRPPSRRSTKSLVFLSPHAKRNFEARTNLATNSRNSALSTEEMRIEMDAGERAALGGRRSWRRLRRGSPQQIGPEEGMENRTSNVEILVPLTSSTIASPTSTSTTQLPNPTTTETESSTFGPTTDTGNISGETTEEGQESVSQEWSSWSSEGGEGMEDTTAVAWNQLSPYDAKDGSCPRCHGVLAEHHEIDDPSHRSSPMDHFQKICSRDEDCINVEFLRCNSSQGNVSGSDAISSCVCGPDMDRAPIRSGKFQGTVWCLVLDGYACTKRETKNEDCASGTCERNNICSRTENSTASELGKTRCGADMRSRMLLLAVLLLLPILLHSALHPT